MSDGETAENHQQKEEVELDSSDDETEKGRSQGGSDHSSDDLELGAEMMMHYSSSQEFKLAPPGNKFEKHQEKNYGGKSTAMMYSSTAVFPLHLAVPLAQKLNPTIKRLPNSRHNHSS